MPTNEKEYEINVDPRILELLGPNLYTNIYYVLAELIANAYDADAKMSISFLTKILLALKTMDTECPTKKEI